MRSAGYILILIIMVSLLSWTPQNCYAQDNEFKDLFLSKQVFKDGFYDSALRNLQQFQKDYPHSKRMFEVEFLIAQCYLKQGHLYKASAAFEQLLEKSGKDHPEKTGEIIFWLGETYFKGKDYKRAQAFYKKIVDEFPESPFASYACYNQAWSFYELKDFENAKQGFEKFIKKYPEHEYVPEAKFKIGEMFFESNDYEQARAFLLVYVKKYTRLENLARAHCLLGEIFYRMGQYPKAIAHYELSLKNGSNSKYAPYARYGIGWAYFDLGDYQASISAFDDFLEFSSSHELAQTVYLQRAEAYRKLKNFNRALELYDEMLKKYPESKWTARILFSQAKSEEALGHIDKAVSIYRSIIKKYSQSKISAEVHYSLGVLYLDRLDRKDEAIKEFKIAFDLSDDAETKVNSLVKIADIYLGSGDVELAQKEYDKILLQFGDNEYADYAQYQLGVSFLKQGRFDAAVLAFRNVIDNFSESRFTARAKYNLGITYFKKGDYDLAIKELDGAVTEYPGRDFEEEARFHIAASLYNKKEFAGAINIYTQLIKTVKDKELLWRCINQRAWAYYNSKKEKEAVAAFSDFIARYPNAPIVNDTRFWLGQYYLRNDNYNKAKACFSAIVNDKNTQSELKADALYQLAICFSKLGNQEMAKRNFRLLKKVFPKSEFIPESMLKIAAILKEQNKIERAQIELKQLAVEQANSVYGAIAYKELAGIAYEQKEYKKAIIYLEKALACPKVLPELKAQLQYELGTMRERDKDLDRAMDEYLKVVYLYPEAKKLVSKSYFNTASILETKEDYVKAEEIYEKIIKADLPDKENAKERIKWIKENQ